MRGVRTGSLSTLAVVAAIGLAACGEDGSITLPTRTTATTVEAPPPETEAPPPETEAPPPETEAPPPETEAPPPETEAPPPETEAPAETTPEPEEAAPEVPADDAEGTNWFAWLVGAVIAALGLAGLAAVLRSMRRAKDHRRWDEAAGAIRFDAEGVFAASASALTPIDQTRAGAWALATRLDDLAKVTDDIERTGVAAGAAQALRAWAAAAESAALARRAVPAPTAEQLLVVDGQAGAAEAALRTALHRLPAPTQPTAGAGVSPP
jgi:hypothetical protein